MIARTYWRLAVAAAAMLGAANGVGAEAPDAAKPLLSDLMLLTQFREVKLWYAEKADNWRLAAYELDQLRTTMGRIVALYPTTNTVVQAELIREKTDPAVAQLKQAIDARDKAAFEEAYGRVTDACNACHEAAGYGFIAVRVPTKSPFGNQLFEPQP